MQFFIARKKNKTLINADFCAGSIVITFRALIGKVSAGQMIIIASFKSFFCWLNEALVIVIMVEADIGSKIIIPLFRDSFGLEYILISSQK